MDIFKVDDILINYLNVELCIHLGGGSLYKT
jgi:hypothetical protein